MTFHLTHEQLCDHLLEITPVADPIPGGKTRTTTSGFHVVEDHLRACPLCAAELRSLETSLSNFQAATTSFANQELSLLRSLYPNRVNLRSITSAAPRPAIHLYQKPFVWAIAAGLVVAASVGTLVPRGLHQQPALHARQRGRGGDPPGRSRPGVRPGAARRGRRRSLVQRPLGHGAPVRSNLLLIRGRDSHAPG